MAVSKDGAMDYKSVSLIHDFNTLPVRTTGLKEAK